MLTDIIPATHRKKFYAGFALVGLALGAVQVAYVAAATGQPAWLNIAFAVFGFVSTGFGFTAKANVPDESEGLGE